MQVHMYVHTYVLEANEISVADEVVLLVIAVPIVVAAVIVALDISGELTLVVANCWSRKSMIYVTYGAKF